MQIPITSRPSTFYSTLYMYVLSTTCHLPSSYKFIEHSPLMSISSLLKGCVRVFVCMPVLGWGVGGKNMIVFVNL